ncbi:cytochrome c oxidase accessory protein CcoG [Roseomonas sp. NAR14]|uniref:Cytochrome c oxidase accessory protein CcoG n=1 Tax=Roseomonas acroporae TaxID=2937791 RepID=A0A9X2BX98_9PROT|nr:cytochrome c oxidase accessory protein CcoG [Roseomonas acroporae]MCK8784770.1 cytochrome c oxidase accessory protein CcoG [Roseomonas acroporae]
MSRIDPRPPVAAGADGHDGAGQSPAPLYATRQKVYPRAVHGPVRRAKWAVLVACLALYYLVPWLRWNRGPGMPDQAVLADIRQARLFLGPIEILPQEVYFITGLLILGAVGLFAVTSLYGRVWCGFTCPQTVWTDLFMWVERRIEGDRNARMKLDAQPLSAGKALRKVAKHAAWLLIALLTGGAWIMYFIDAPTVVREFFSGRASAETYLFVGLFTFTTYLLAGWAREQVCTYMCPWPRFQAAMLDENSLVVSYRAWRGEPQGKPSQPGVGDCVNCHACVHVCPTGIDIRDGQQLECIGCALCADACDDVMHRLGRPGGLIAFETLGNLAAATAATAALPPGAARRDPGMAARRPMRAIRPRTLLYGAVMLVVAAAMGTALLLRADQDLAVLRDRAPVYVRLSDGGIRNGYTLKLGNRGTGEAVLHLELDAPPGFFFVVQDAEPDTEGRPLLPLQRDGIGQWRVLVTAPAWVRAHDSTDIRFRVVDEAGRTAASAASVFLGPRP